MIYRLKLERFPIYIIIAIISSRRYNRHAHSVEFCGTASSNARESIYRRIPRALHKRADAYFRLSALYGVPRAREDQRESKLYGHTNRCGIRASLRTAISPWLHFIKIYAGDSVSDATGGSILKMARRGGPLMKTALYDIWTCVTFP